MLILFMYQQNGGGGEKLLSSLRKLFVAKGVYGYRLLRLGAGEFCPLQPLHPQREFLAVERLTAHYTLSL